MTAQARDFRARLRKLLTGAHDTPLVLIGNFGVEDEWARGEVGLPRLGGAARGAAHRMDELTLLLATSRDLVVLRGRPDKGYLEYLADLGLSVPRILAPRRADPRRSVTADILADPDLVAVLSGLAGDGYQLAPHGVSHQEAELSLRTGLALAAPDHAVCKAVNSKVYSRDLAAGHGIRQPDGWAARTLDELAGAFAWARRAVAAGQRVVVKDAFGVSGKGLLVVEDARRFDQLWRLISASSQRTGHDRVGLVVEEWISRRMDLNYQVTIGRDGSGQLDFVKEAITANGVHKGHKFPVPLDRGHPAQIAAAARDIARRLAADGYYGVAGVDAMVDESGELYPVVEINARNNMSTYQATLHEAFLGNGRFAQARHFPLRPARPLPFSVLRQVLGDTLLRPGTRHGLLVTAFATVSAALATDPPGGSGEGRLYSLLVGGSPQEVRALESAVAARLRSSQLGPQGLADGPGPPAAGPRAVRTEAAR